MAQTIQQKSEGSDRFYLQGAETLEKNTENNNFDAQK